MQSSSGGGGGGGGGGGTRARLQARLKGGGGDNNTSDSNTGGSSYHATQAGRGTSQRRPSQTPPSAAAAAATASTRSAAAKSALGNGRMPQAPASLLVQLPPEELKRMLAEQHLRDGTGSASSSAASASLALQRQAAAAASRLGLAGPSSLANVSQPQAIGVTDVAMLAASLQERREREAKVFVWQQRLIGGVSTDRTMLKKALTQLSLPSWLQVLQERHLAHRCAYPTCQRAPKRTHFSYNKSSVLAADAPRYRISLRRRAIERDERDDAGGEHAFCSTTCWRHAEWVSRWVLNGGASTRQVQRAVSEGDEGLLAAEADGGRWERIMDESFWTEIELLEDLEDRGEVERLDDDIDRTSRSATVSPSTSPPNAYTAPVPPIILEAEAIKHATGQYAGLPNALTSNPDEQRAKDGLGDAFQGQLTQVAQERARHRGQPNGGSAEGFLNLLDSLEIRERHNDVLYKSAPQDHSLESIKAEEIEKDDFGDARSLDDIDMLADEENVGNADVIDNQSNFDPVPQGRGERVEARQGATKEQQEEDDLFAQAWAAMDEERAQGRWEEEKEE